MLAKVSYVADILGVTASLKTTSLPKLIDVPETVPITAVPLLLLPASLNATRTLFRSESNIQAL